MKKRTYRTSLIQDVSVDALITLLGATLEAIVAIDVAKQKFVFGFANQLGETLRLVRFEHPKQTRQFLALLEGLRERGVRLAVAMEPTGSYGDALRHQLVSREFPVYLVDPKRCHDASLVFDGVPSQHDPKACTIIAHLHARGLSKPYRPRTADEKRARMLVDRHRMLMRPLGQLAGSLEALLATHWPELNVGGDLRTRWHLELLAAYPGPAAIARDEHGARALLRRVSRGKLRPERIDEVVSSAHDSLGVPVDAHDASMLVAVARSMLQLRGELDALEDEASSFVTEQASPGTKNLAALLGTMTALAVLGDAGDPQSYSSPASLQKALGLNLRERSSGEHKGKLRITKRGSARARQYLFFAALRLIQYDPIVRVWFAKRCGNGSKIRAVVAVMRKLVLALPHVARGEPFDATKLFDVRRLDLPAATESVSGDPIG